MELKNVNKTKSTKWRPMYRLWTQWSYV